MNRASSSAASRTLGDAIASLLDVPVQMAAAVSGALGGARRAGARCGCEIPPPCWEPQLVGTCSLAVQPGGVGTIRVHVTNCDWSRDVVGITATGRLASVVKFEPTTITVEPQSSEVIVVTVHVPEGVKPGERFSGALLVRGCADHFARIHVGVAECAGRSCCEVFVQDCPDHVHHWYDHFYCPRPCRSAKLPDREGVVTHG